jgi:fatty-acyl-CoA synthase
VSVTGPQTLQQAIPEAAARHPDNGFTFQDLHGNEVTYRFPEIAAATARRAAGLQQLGLERGDRMGLVVIEPADFVLTFLAAVRIGVVPVPIYPPLYLGNLQLYSRQTARILRSCDARVVIASGNLCNILWAIAGELPALALGVVQVQGLDRDDGAPDYPDLSPDDLVFLQYTSGSTSEPRGVMVTHCSLVANIEGFMGAGLRMVAGQDSGCSWLPLYHDMGLVGFVLGPLYWGVSVVFIPTLRFVKNAAAWLETIHRHRATVSFGPNFAFALATRRARPADLERWDLSCVKALGCGSEPIRAGTLREFSRLFGERCGLRPTALLPAYGLAEATLAVTMKPLDQPMRVRRVDGSRFQRLGVASEAQGDLAEDHVSCGVPFPGHEVVITGPAGERLDPGQEGEIWVRGPSVAAGYFGAADDGDAAPTSWEDGWLRTGDLGYLWDGELYVTGRLKDLIILNGRNLHPQTIEWTVAEVAGIRRGNVVAFPRAGQDTEELVIVAEVRCSDPERLVAEVIDVVRRDFSVSPADVVCLEPGRLPKTSSGKVQRRRVRQLYLSGELGQAAHRGAAGDRLRLAAHLARGLRARARSLLTKLVSNGSAAR